MNQTTSDIDVIMDNLEKARARQGVLLDKLRVSMKIKLLWPEAFADGNTCTPFLTGTAHGPGSLQPRRFPPPWDDVRVVKTCGLRRRDGVEKLLTVEDFMSIFGEAQ